MKLEKALGVVLVVTQASMVSVAFADDSIAETLQKDSKLNLIQLGITHEPYPITEAYARQVVDLQTKCQANLKAAMQAALPKNKEEITTFAQTIKDSLSNAQGSTPDIQKCANDVLEAVKKDDLVAVKGLVHTLSDKIAAVGTLGGAAFLLGSISDTLDAIDNEQNTLSQLNAGNVDACSFNYGIIGSSTIVRTSFRYADETRPSGLLMYRATPVKTEDLPGYVDLTKVPKGSDKDQYFILVFNYAQAPMEIRPETRLAKQSSNGKFWILGATDSTWYEITDVSDTVYETRRLFLPGSDEQIRRFRGWINPGIRYADYNFPSYITEPGTGKIAELARVDAEREAAYKRKRMQPIPASAVPPECKFVGTSFESWYFGGVQIDGNDCAKRTLTCDQAGTPNEGWYSVPQVANDPVQAYAVMLGKCSK